MFESRKEHLFPKGFFFSYQKTPFNTSITLKGVLPVVADIKWTFFPWIFDAETASVSPGCSNWAVVNFPNSDLKLLAFLLSCRYSSDLLLIVSISWSCHGFFIAFWPRRGHPEKATSSISSDFSVLVDDTKRSRRCTQNTPMIVTVKTYNLENKSVATV